MNTHNFNSKITYAMLISLLFLAGCSSDDNPTAPGPEPHSAVIQDGSLQLKVSTDKASYAYGTDVIVTLSLRNTGSNLIPLDFNRGNPARYLNLNINAKDDDDFAHFVVGDGTADVTSLAPGAVISYSWIWDQGSRLTRDPVERGFVELVGFVSFDNRDTMRVDSLFIELK